jgi:small basic protein (TIGR04137 family)
VTVDKSLKVKGQLRGRRNVLSREDRLVLLEGESRWQPGQPVTGLPKVSTRIHKARVKKKKEKAPEAGPQAEVAPAEAGQEPGRKARKS